MAKKTLLIVGLGNPGRKYEKTRHNIGTMVINALADSFGTALKDLRWEARIGRARPSGEKNDAEIILLEPQTFMNLSGTSVSGAMRFYKSSAEDLMVIHDEIELPFAEIRLKKGGGHKGHNGLRDIIARTGSADFHRLRIGVGRPEHTDVAGYLLAPFSAEEQQALEGIISSSCRFLQDWLQDSLQD